MWERRRSHWTTPLFIVVLLVLLVLLASPAIEPTAGDTTEQANVTAYRTSTTEFASADAIERGIANGTIEPADKIVVGETLLVAIESDRLAARMADHNGTPTDRFLDSLNGTAEFRLLQTNPTPQRPSKVATVGARNVSVHRNESTTYVLVATDQLTFRYGPDKRAQIYGGERFAVQFGYNLTGLPVSKTSPKNAIIELYQYKSTFETIESGYNPLPPEWVQFGVDVNIEPEASLVARLTVDNQPISVPISQTELPGRERFWIDLRDADPGSEYVLKLIHDGEVVDRYTGTIQKPRARVTHPRLVEVTTDDVVVTEDGERVTKTITDHTAVKASVMLSHGGKVQVFNGECEQIGYKWIDPTNETTVTIPLWNESNPVRGANHSEYGVRIRSVRTNGAGERLYQGSKSRATINLDGQCQAPAAPSTPTPTATPPPTSPQPTTIPQTATRTVTQTTQRPDTPVQNGTDPTESPGQPGFTVLTILLALLVITLITLRGGIESE